MKFLGFGVIVAPGFCKKVKMFPKRLLNNLKILISVNLICSFQYNGKIKTISEVSTHTGKKVTATSGQTVLLDVDGEQPGTLPVTIDIIPGALNIISAK